MTETARRHLLPRGAVIAVMPAPLTAGPPWTYAATGAEIDGEVAKALRTRESIRPVLAWAHRWATTLSRFLKDLWLAARLAPARRNRLEQGASWPTIFGWEPLVDILDTEAGLVVAVALSGVQPEDVKTVVCHGEILLQGIRRAPELQRSSRAYRKELPDGPFAASLALPSGAYQLVRKEHVDGWLLFTLYRLDSTRRGSL